jgi:chromate transporter
MSSDPTTRRGKLVELATVFTRLGFTAFGGPAAHLGLIESEVVQRRAWLDRRHFLDVVAAVNFIPGPNSTELVIYLGWLRAGLAGLIVAGTCFIFPAVLIILPIAWVYVRYGATPQAQPVLQTVSAAMLAIVIAALWRLAQTALRDVVSICIAIVGGVIYFRFPDSELWILAGAALVGWLRTTSVILPVFALPLLASPASLPSASMTKSLVSMGLFFLRVGATLYGSGYVLISFLQTGLVNDHGWLTRQQLLDAVAVGQFTPGPLLTTATFAGYVIGAKTFQGGTAIGIAGALIATIAIFLPSFVVVALVGPQIERLQKNPRARGALDAMNAAVVALIFVVSLQLTSAALLVPNTHHPDAVQIAVFLVSLVAMLRWKLNATWFVLAAAVVGIVRYAFLTHS